MSLNFQYLFLIFIVFITISCQNTGEAPDTSKSQYTQWKYYHGDAHGSQFSNLDQINKNNVEKLEVAWTYSTGDKDPENRSQIQCNPIVVDGVLFGTSPKLKLFALDAATGEENWVFNPYGENLDKGGLGVNRGVAYWEDEQGKNGRILYSAGEFLYAVNAQTGKAVQEFGKNGKIKISKGIDSTLIQGFYMATSPGVIYKDIIIIGSRVSEGAKSSPGDIRAYNVKTGEVEWVFHTIPRQGEFGYDTWPKGARKETGGANSWSGMSLDKERGIVYIPTGSPAFDFYGGNRKGKNLFGNCILALDAETGERKWHFQVVHHDILDRDLPAPPDLVRVKHEGSYQDAVAQITKHGYIFLLNRETGEPLIPVEERPVPTDALPGEHPWSTQPFPVRPEPYARQKFTEDLVTNISEEAHQFILDSLRKLKVGGPFQPPSKQGTIIYPGFDGGGEWGGAAFDPGTGILYVNSNEMAWVQKIVEIEEKEEMDLQAQGRNIYSDNCASCHGMNLEGQQGNPGLTNIQEKYGVSEVRNLINQGKGVMPSFSGLAKEEKSAILSFLFERNIETEQKNSPKEPSSGSRKIPFRHTGYNRFFDQNGYPAVKPPWGTLNAIDLNKGKILWKVPLGELPELKERGIPKTGTENYGGPVVTKGGLIFIGASKDEKFRAFDKETGELLWKTDLPAGGYATPATYSIDGKQYVVIAAGGGKMGTKSGDTYVAFALPQE